jgi:hypothetical protein
LYFILITSDEQTFPNQEDMALAFIAEHTVMLCRHLQAPIMLHCNITLDCSGTVDWWDPMVTWIMQHRPSHDDDYVYAADDNTRHWHLNLTTIDSYWWKFVVHWWKTHHSEIPLMDDGNRRLRADMDEQQP